MDYKDFYTVFLAEMPQRLNGENDFQAVLEMLQENLKYNTDVEVLGPNIFKTQNDMQITYWVGDAAADEVKLIVDTTIHQNFQKVEYTTKNPNNAKGSGPFASDLYNIIKQDAGNSNLVFTSDTLVSDDAARLWKRLASTNHQISVYDTNAQQYILTNVTDSDELTAYIGNADNRKYIFVLSESVKHSRGVIHSFALMELKRNAGYPLHELFEQLKKN